MVRVTVTINLFSSFQNKCTLAGLYWIVVQVLWYAWHVYYYWVKSFCFVIVALWFCPEVLKKKRMYGQILLGCCMDDMVYRMLPCRKDFCFVLLAFLICSVVLKINVFMAGQTCFLIYSEESLFVLVALLFCPMVLERNACMAGLYWVVVRMMW